jgi:hypothetical protein
LWLRWGIAYRLHWECSHAAVNFVSGITFSMHYAFGFGNFEVVPKTKQQKSGIGLKKPLLFSGMLSGGYPSKILA